MKKMNVRGLSVSEIDSKTVIAAPTGAAYLSEFMDTLPAGILNKKETGCGATTVVLENGEDVIIACPTRFLIINKVSQYPNERCSYKLLGVQKGVGQQHIEDYVDECFGKQPIKIMATYDSFPRVFSLTKQKGIECKIVVDEYQELLDAYVYRNTAIRNLLNELKDIPNVTYLSATPIPYKWSNSVSAISNIIESTGLTSDDVTVICADNEINKLKLKGLPVGKVQEKNKIFTFCTKTTFYGADFYSDAGLAIIVSDGNAKSSLLDIATDITQIAGRIRTKENPFKNIILHIYNTGIMCESKAEHEAKLHERLVSAQKIVEIFNNSSLESRGAIIERIKENNPEEFASYNIENQMLEIDEMKKAHAEYKFEAIDNVYANGILLRDAYLNKGYDVKNADEKIKNIYQNVYWGMGRSRFEILYRTYSDSRKHPPVIKSELPEDVLLQNDIVPLAYNLLGDKEVERLGYDEKKVSDWVHFKLPETQKALKEKLKETFIAGHKYLFKEIKQQLKSFFKELGIGITPKATLISKYFNTKKVKIPTENKRKDGYQINNALFLCVSTKKSNVVFYDFYPIR